MALEGGGVKRTTEKVGKPNKVDDPDVLEVVEKELCINAQASSWLEVVPGRKNGLPEETCESTCLDRATQHIFLRLPLSPAHCKVVHLKANMCEAFPSL